MATPNATVGMLAPDFALPCTRVFGSDRTRAALPDYRGRWLTLLFYPRDFSMICPTEISMMSNRLEEFQRRECEVLAVSTDSVATHERWIMTPRSQGGLGGLNFPLASDEDGAACQAYGVYMPRQHLALRGLFIIDPNGVLQYQVVHNLSVGRRTDEVLRVLDALQTGGLCPENWTPADATLDPASTLGPGRVIGQYRIEELIGTGAFGSVFRAQDLLLRRTVALKIMRPDNRLAADAVLIEARAAAALSHPNVCTVYTVDISEGVSLIAMEYLAGRPLSKLIEAGPLPVADAVSIVCQIAHGMAAAHTAGVIHGDLKPANLMVGPEGTVKIMDFGLSRRDPSSHSQQTTLLGETAPRGISGTPSYMSPEQARGQPLTAATDIFSLGLVIYEMLTGAMAMSGTGLLEVLRQVENANAADLAARLPDPFAEIVRRGLVIDPKARVLTMQGIVELLA
jgi:alkyl hydroperoxide reductase subunit AhpC/predicted Ser/Thr protein kinase